MECPYKISIIKLIQPGSNFAEFNKIKNKQESKIKKKNNKQKIDESIILQKDLVQKREKMAF